MRRAALLFAVALGGAGVLGGCNAILGNDGWSPAGGANPFAPGVDAAHDQGSGGDAAAGLDATVAHPDAHAPGDAGPADSLPPTDAYDSGLDPLLVLPPPDGAACWPPGGGQCPGYGSCEISSPDAASCAPCPQGSCGGHLHDFCSGPSDCDVLFECYEGKCFAPCWIDAGECTPYCKYVGNDTYGVCLAP